MCVTDSIRKPHIFGINRQSSCCLQYMIQMSCCRAVQNTEPEYKLEATDEDIQRGYPQEDEDSGDNGSGGNLVPFEESIAACKRKLHLQSCVANLPGCGT